MANAKPIQFYQPAIVPRIVAVQIGEKGAQVDEVPFLACYHSPNDNHQEDGFMVFDDMARVPSRLDQCCWLHCDAVLIIGFAPESDPWWQWQIDEAVSRLKAAK